jgi:hypothetical protein
MDILFVDVPIERIESAMDVLKDYLYGHTSKTLVDKGYSNCTYVLLVERAFVQIKNKGYDGLMVKWIPDDL